MLTTLSIISMNQGKLEPRLGFEPRSEEEPARQKRAGHLHDSIRAKASRRLRCSLLAVAAIALLPMHSARAGVIPNDEQQLRALIA